MNWMFWKKTSSELKKPALHSAEKEEILMLPNVQVQVTPNPNALKFVCDRDVVNGERVSVTTAEMAESVPMIKNLFELPYVDQVHLNENAITVTKKSSISWNLCEKEVLDIIRMSLSSHNASFELAQAKPKKSIDPEVLKIEEILDRTVRPGLQGDGGDLEIIKLDQNVLHINYQGACGSCPSSIYGTLEAIKAILRDEYDPDIEVVVVN